MYKERNDFPVHNCCKSEDRNMDVVVTPLHLNLRHVEVQIQGHSYFNMFKASYILLGAESTVYIAIEH